MSNQKVKGFTLIELLAVIVILAIIAVIAVPIVLKIINESKESSVLRSAEFYLDAVEIAIALEKLEESVIDGDYKIQKDGCLCIIENGTVDCEKPIIIDMNGNKPSDGTIVIENGIVVSKSSTTEAITTITIGDYDVIYDE